MNERALAWLAPSVHAVRIEEDLVFLDLRADAYTCLAGGANAIRFEAGERRLAFEDADDATELFAAGLTVTGPRPPSLTPRAWPGPARSSALPPSSPPAGLADVPPVARATWEVLRRYRGRGLADLIGDTRRGGALQPETTPSPALLAAVARFHRWAPYAPVSGKCLLRAFMLLRELRRTGHDALWVFGVSTWPFLAHCWLQAGEVVLDDTHERVGGYTPILVV